MNNNRKFIRISIIAFTRESIFVTLTHHQQPIIEKALERWRYWMKYVWSSRPLSACYFTFPLHPFSPTEHININQKKNSQQGTRFLLPKTGKIASGHHHPSNTHRKYLLPRPRQTHQTSRADDSRPPWRLTVLSCTLPPSASLSILNGAAHWPEWARKSPWCLPELGSL